MRAEDLVFWLDALRPDTDLTHGVLCRRHADSMIVPRHWTLDDLRDPEPRLFRTATAPQAPTSPARVRRRVAPLVTHAEQMTLVPDQASVDVAEQAVLQPVLQPVGEVDRHETPAVAWTPSFDVHDDLDGLLSARSPLLARAFRGDDRPKPG